MSSWLAAAVAGATACGHQSNAPDAAVANASSQHEVPEQPSTAESQPPVFTSRAPAAQASVPNHIPELLIDVSIARACEELSGRFLAMSSKAGTSFEGGKQATVGTLWIESCRVAETSSEQLELSLEGRGWKWIDRTSEKILADFSVEQYLRFGIKVGVNGTLSMHYAPDEHIATFWFEHSQAPTRSFTALQDVEVDEEGLWSEVVGVAATLVATDPDQKADQKTRKKGQRKLDQKLEDGFSFAYDLCTSRSYTKTGRLQPGKLPEPAIVYQDDRDYQVNSDAVLHTGGLILAGPFQLDQQLIAEVRVADDSASVSARLVCRAEAEQLANAYLAQQELPRVAQIAVARVDSGASRQLKLGSARCEPTLALEVSEQASQRTRAELKYSVYYAGEERRPLARCSSGSR